MFPLFREGPMTIGIAGSARGAGKYAFGSEECAQTNQLGRWQTKACLFLDQIKREKGVWWMPWQQEAMKDVILCDKLWGAENRL